jgi:Phosphotransferase enzyme family
MMGAETWGDGAEFHKRYGSVEQARRAMLRTTEVLRAGVRTPAARFGDQADVVIFQRIAASGAANLAEMLGLLTDLRRMPTDVLERFDPFARIVPRLPPAPPEIGLLVKHLQTMDAALEWHASNAVHGDFHPGQVIRDRDGMVWLLDLDDLALGPAEADLGNLAAWMATQEPGRLKDQAAQAIAAVLAASGTADAAMVAHFCDIALVRRALKLREKGIDWVIGQLPLVA